MSGNPFRRPQAAATAPPISTDHLPDAVDDDDDDSAVAASPPRTKLGKNGKPKKRVTIISPPQSPLETHDRPRRISDGGTGSPPPPPVTVDREDELATDTTNADKDLERALENTRRNSQGSDPLPPPVPPGTETTRAPYNPFARTLATSEASFGLQKATGTDEQAERNRQGPPKMNVDMFKNILMTGSASPSPPVAPSAQTPQRHEASSNSTDTSSLSQQSLFDPSHGAHAESPRSSFDQRLESDSEDEDQNEHSSLMGPVATRPEAEGPPPPPKHKHGKALAARGPQTVSFADFNESIPQGWQTPPGPGTPPPQSSPRGGILRPSTPRSPPSDLNKPLPPPPEAMASSATAVPATESTEASAAAPTFSPTREEPPQAKKAPPPPPASRRQAQASAGRARSGSNLTQNSIQEEDESPAIPRIAPPSTKLAPPPPPARRANNPSLAQASSAAETPPATEASSPLTQLPSSENKPMPPPPPRRTHSKTASITRTSSNASRTSIPRSGNSENAPPAPPPRRGAGSGRNSLDGASRRLSGQDHRRTSGQSDASSLQQVDEGEDKRAEQPPQRDMLADLAALQAEVDALRAKAGQG